MSRKDSRAASWASAAKTLPLLCRSRLHRCLCRVACSTHELRRGPLQPTSLSTATGLILSGSPHASSDCSATVLHPSASVHPRLQLALLSTTRRILPKPHQRIPAKSSGNKPRLRRTDIYPTSI